MTLMQRSLSNLLVNLAKKPHHERGFDSVNKCEKIINIYIVKNVIVKNIVIKTVFFKIVEIKVVEKFVKKSKTNYKYCKCSKKNVHNVLTNL